MASIERLCDFLKVIITYHGYRYMTCPYMNTDNYVALVDTIYYYLNKITQLLFTKLLYNP